MSIANYNLPFLQNAAQHQKEFEAKLDRIDALDPSATSRFLEIKQKMQLENVAIQLELQTMHGLVKKTVNRL